MTIGILGGGISGLALGYFLRGKEDFEILEGTPVCGGLCRSFIENGFTFDYASGHIIFSKDKGVLDIMLKILGDNIIKNKRNTKIYYKGKFVKYPFENGLSDLPPEENKECLETFLNNPFKKTPQNFKEWIYHNFGSGIAEKYLIPYNEKIWKTPAEEMTHSWVDGRVPKPPAEDIIKSSKGISTEGYTHQLYFYYPLKGGIQAMTDAMLAQIGDNAKTNFRIKSIKKKGGKWFVSDGKEEHAYDKLVSTIALFDLVNIVEGVPEEVKKAASNLRYNSVIGIMLGLDYDNGLDLSWLYFPQNEIPFHRIVFQSNYSPNLAPDGKSSIMVELTYRPGDGVAKMSDEQILNLVIPKLEEVNMIKKDKIVYKKVCRNKYGYVVYTLGYEKNLKIVMDYFNKLGIDSLGRFAEFKYINTDACVRGALDLSKKLLS
ncbi:TPA: FAD-dependent oxidoreductase [archaeon]|uniref:FAD-dependent oxidoreductase n=1 Tax=Candidatus Naiadarchaeum limnaeum TaxID=2756139 RepID=A0A832X5U3_9ARCH|nr:FAD-dependent oxidoreductase [Candidatus Naiadarchaeum limnaeum]